MNEKEQKRSAISTKNLKISVTFGYGCYAAILRRNNSI